MLWAYILPLFPPEIAWDYWAPFFVVAPLPGLVSLLAVRIVFIVGATTAREAAAFVRTCKKGSIFGIGFLFLLASFVLRFANLK